MGDISVFISVFLLIFSLIACVISALFNAYFFCGICYLQGKKDVYDKGYLFYFSIYAFFSFVFICINLIPSLCQYLISIIVISSIISVLFGTFLMGKIFDNADAKSLNLMLSIVLFALGIPAFLGGLYILSLFGKSLIKLVLNY